MVKIRDCLALLLYDQRLSNPSNHLFFEVRTTHLLTISPLATLTYLMSSGAVCAVTSNASYTHLPFQ